MKNLLLIGLSTLSLNTVAQTNDIDSRIELSMNRLSELVLRQNLHRFLNPNQKRDLLESINNSILIVNDDSQQGPGPGPRP